MKIAEFMNRKKDFLVYHGNHGIGKTFLCSALLEWALLNFSSFRYWKEADLNKRVRDAIDKYSSGDYLDELKYCIDDDLLMIDDIGSQDLTQFRKDNLFYVIDERYSSRKPTIIISNLSRKQFEREFPGRFISRLFAKDNIIIDLDDGVDLRQE